MYHKCPGRVRCVALGTSSPRQQFESNENRCTLTSISSKKKRKTGQTKSDTNNQPRPKPVAEAGRPTRWCQTSSPLNAQCHRYTMRRGHAEARHQHLDKKKKSIRVLNLPTRPPRRQILVKVFQGRGGMKKESIEKKTKKVEPTQRATTRIFLNNNLNLNIKQ